jgi:hypothetical protein
MSMVYWAMSVAQVVFGVAVYALTATGTLGKPDYNLAITMQKVAIFLIPLSMGAGYFVFRSMLARIDKNIALEAKVRRYFALVLIRGALFEGAFLFCCVAALITGVQLFLWISPVIFLVFLLLRPTPEGIAADLELNPADRNRLVVQ